MRQLGFDSALAIVGIMFMVMRGVVLYTSVDPAAAVWLDVVAIGFLSGAVIAGITLENYIGAAFWFVAAALLTIGVVT